MTQTFSIRGMTCNSCVRHVKDALLRVPGVRTVSVSLAGAQATIETGAEISREHIVAALDEAGYSLA
jgi:copper chaperone CopZ